MMARIYLWGCIAVLLIGLGAGTVWYFVADKIAALKAQRESLTEQLQLDAKARRLAQEVSTARAGVRTQRVGEAASAAAGDAAALAKAKAWADTPVPQEVRDALR